MPQSLHPIALVKFLSLTSFTPRPTMKLALAAKPSGIRAISRPASVRGRLHVANVAAVPSQSLPSDDMRTHDDPSKPNLVRPVCVGHRPVVLLPPVFCPSFDPDMIELNP